MKVLNRDLWSNAGVKAIVGEHFVFWQQYKVKWQNVKFSQEQIPGKWRGCSVYDLLPNHWVATCLNSRPKDGRKHGHMEQVNTLFVSFFDVDLVRLDAAAFPTLITEFLSLHPSLESPGKEEPPRKKVATF